MPTLLIFWPLLFTFSIHFVKESRYNYTYILYIGVSRVIGSVDANRSAIYFVKYLTIQTD